LAEQQLESRLRGSREKAESKEEVDEEEEEVVRSLPIVLTLPSSQASRRQMSLEEPEQLSWCVICNADAALRCAGCSGDLYCKRCYAECHEDENPTEHRTSVHSTK
jgi:hypothetical protein